MKKVVFLLAISFLIVTGCSVKKTSELSNAERFAVEYSVSEDNPFYYASLNEVFDIFENGTGIIFFGNSDSEWSIKTASIFNEVLDSEDISKVYYYNPKNIRDKNTNNYKKLIKYVDEFLEKDSDGNTILNLPDVYFVRDGSIVGHNNDTALKSEIDKDNFDKKAIKKLKSKYATLIDEYKKKCTENI